MEIKEKIEEVIKKLTSDPNLMEEFKADPVKTMEEKLGVDLPDDKIDEVVAAVKAKVDLEDIAEGIKKIEGLFHKDK